MGYRNFKYRLSLYLLALLAGMAGFGICLYLKQVYPAIGFAVVVIWLLYKIWNYINRRFDEVTDFLESVKYRDYSRLFNDATGPKDLRKLHQQFNVVLNTIKEVNQENVLQNIYLQKVLELANTGIIAYNTRSNRILWINDSARELLNVPAFRNIEFLQSRKPDFYRTIIENKHFESSIVTTSIEEEKLRLLVSDAIFRNEKEDIRILVLQNMDETLEQTESDAWKKLLRVMTHEIMNSIAPIHSLSETLKLQLTEQQNHRETDLPDTNDILWGIESIRKRSEGLMQFAKTYRSLHRITQLHLQQVSVKALLDDMVHLLGPSIEQKGITLETSVTPEHLLLDIDQPLIEQVLINLVKNAMESLQDIEDGRISITAFNNARGHTVIRVTDNGPGIPEEIRENIFIPFYTSKKSGSGIGLSLCKEIMLLHRGKIQLENTETPGTTMSLIF